jgi:hypothetical protein
MEDLVDLIATDGKPSDITDKIKELLYAKAGEKIDSVVPEVTASMFDDYESGENE